MLLYQFPLSHYCEKARWALEFKGIDYKIRNLAPGPHLFQTKRLAPKSSVPILVDGKNVVQDSSAILDYLDQRYPNPALTPSETSARQEALELEEYFDKEAGVHLRRYFYFYILQNRKLATSLLLREGPRSARVMYFFLFPALRKLMKKAMNIYPQPTQASEKSLGDVLEFLNKRVANQSFLVGNTFSRADLCAASLLAPLCRPPEHACTWPRDEEMPSALLAFQKTYESSPAFQWVLNTYRDFRINR